jgi:hypothetical protein
MDILKKQQVERIHHYAPLHYLPFIGRSKSLLSKPSILAAGFKLSHLRSMSHRQDAARGFASYTHLTLDESPRILKGKLAAGFPHIRISVPAETVDAIEFSLCRYNVAMTRYLRRDGEPGFLESPTNGRYYGQHQIPIARTDADKTAMLQKHLTENTMIEVLIHGDFALPDATDIVCFSPADAEIAQMVLSAVGTSWRIATVPSPRPYARNALHVKAVSEFIKRALAEPEWRGNGLEFDRL